MNIALLPLLFAALRLWTPLVFAALGGVVSERSGVVNIGLEAMMLGGAFASVAGAHATGNTFAGLLVGIFAGALVGLLHAVFTQALRVPHILSGVGLNLGLLGLTTFALRSYPNGALESPRQLPGELLTAVAALFVVLLYFVLNQTPLGLRLRACGENPRAARSAGVAVEKIRYGAVITSGGLAGLSGVALALGGIGAFTENMTAGRGYIALAAVIFGRWNPVGVALAALVFGFGDALQLSLQTAGLSKTIPPDFLTLLPYVLTLIALAVGRETRASTPGALGETE